MATPARNKRFILGLAVAGLLPLSFYVIAKALAKDKLELPRHYVVERVAAPGDTVWHRAADLRGINQVGETVSLNESLQGRLLAVSFFFTECPTVCPKLTENMRLLQRAFTRTGKETFDTVRVQLVSISVDPTTDSPARLRAYADAHRANHDRWWFIQAPRAEVARYMRQDLGLAGGTGEGGAEDLQHSQSIVILDRERYIRGVYNGLDPVDLKRCADDLVLLSMEKKRKGKR